MPARRRSLSDEDVKPNKKPKLDVAASTKTESHTPRAVKGLRPNFPLELEEEMVPHMAATKSILASQTYPVVEEKLAKAMKRVWNPAKEKYGSDHYHNLNVLHSRTEFQVVKGLYMEVKIYNAEPALLENQVLKADCFPGVHRLPSEKLHPGLNNWRMVPVPYLSVFGCGQPSVEALYFLLDHLEERGFEEVVCINFREEPTVYVNGQSYTVRESTTLNANVDHLLGIEAHNIERLEERLRADVYRLAANEDGKLYVTVENDEFKNVREVEHIRRGSVKTVSTLYHTLKQEYEGRLNVKYSRIPVTDELAPQESDFDVLIKLIRAADKSHALVFNCQMGRGRTTTALICACLLNRKRIEQLNHEGHVYDPKNPDYQRGQWKAIMQLVHKLADGQQAKANVDEIIDVCAEVQNLRTCIVEYKEKETEKAINYLERYWWLIVFSSYVNEQQPREFEAPFTQWMNRRWGLRRLLRNLKLE